MEKKCVLFVPLVPFYSVRAFFSLHYNRIKEEQGNKRTHRINHKIVNK